MVADHGTRAVFAGLVTSTTLWALPSVAVAAPADGAAGGLVTAGAALAGFAVGACATALWCRRQGEEERDELRARIRALEAAVQETRAQPRVRGRHVASGAPRYRLNREGEAPLPTPAAEPAPAAAVAEATPVAAEAAPVAPAPAEPVPDPVADAPRPRGRHFKDSVAAQPPAASAAPVPAAAGSAPTGVAATIADRVPSLDDVPRPAAVPSMTASSPVLGDFAGVHAAAAVDYESVAVDYVERKTFKNRMIALSKGVGRVLAERLGGDMMDDLPMIQRADGTVADVGTAWWEAAAAMNDLEISRDLGAELASVTETADRVRRAVDESTSFESPFSADDVPAARRRGEGSVVAPDAPAPAPVVVTAGPDDPTDAMELAGRSDGWEQALDALDHRFDDNLVSGAPDPAPSVRCEVEPVPDASRFEDFVGGDDTLDEPDGLEPDTQFLTFRVPAGHPEVTDTASYVNYLLANELGENRSRTARRAAKKALKVIPGGTSPNLQVV